MEYQAYEDQIGLFNGSDLQWPDARDSLTPSAPASMHPTAARRRTRPARVALWSAQRNQPCPSNQRHRPRSWQVVDPSFLLVDSIAD